MADQADQWYYGVGELELGPISFDELLDLAKTQQISADDNVRFGIDGSWRRAGSIGRLMAALPYQSPSARPKASPRKEKTPSFRSPEASDAATLEAALLVDSLLAEPTAVEPRSSQVSVELPPATVDSDAAFQLAFQQAQQAISASILSQAEAAFQSAEASAKSEVAWAFAPNIDRHWWGWMGSVEFGPIEFSQLFALARNGQVRPSDFVRNGEFAQFVPSSNVPGLFSAVAKISKAAEALELARAQARAAVDAAIPAPSPQARSSIALGRSATPPREFPVTRPVVKAQNLEAIVSESLVSEDEPRVSSLQRRAAEPIAVRSTNRPSVEVDDSEHVPDPPRTVNRAVADPPPDVWVRPVVPPVAVNRPAAVRKGRSSSSSSGMFDGLIETLKGEYSGHLIGIAAAALFLGYWFFPRGPVRPVAVHPVKGQVLMDGEPLANAVIALHQIGQAKVKSKLPKHLHPHGKAASDGTFALETFDPADGAPDGEFVATVFLVEETVDQDGDKSYGPNLLPPLYGKPESSPFKLKITGSTKELEPLKLTRQ